MCKKYNIFFYFYELHSFCIIVLKESLISFRYADTYRRQCKNYQYILISSFNLIKKWLRNFILD